MRISAIALLSPPREPRILRLGPGLNIVTGWSGTGKSSLLDIVEFCLGRQHPTYPAGVLSRAVDWFAVELELAGARVTIARPAPRPGAATASGALLAIGSTIDEIAAGELATNADASAVRSELTRMLGIAANEVRPEGPVRPALVATASQALLLSFQAQGEIANKALLFHRTDDQQIRDALRDTLPFFIGAVDFDTVGLRRQLDERRRELRRAETGLIRARLASSRSADGSAALLAEAAVVGLIEDGDVDAVGEAALGVLERVAVLPEHGAEPGEYRAADQVAAGLRARQRELINVVSVVEHRLATLGSSVSDRREYTNEIAEQHQRLRSIGLLPQASAGDESSACPACGQDVLEDADEVEAIRAAVRELEDRLAGLRASEPASGHIRTELEGALTGAREELLEATAAIAAATRADVELARSGELAQQSAYVRGRIHEFLAGLPASDDELAAREREVSRLSAEVERLAEQLDPTSFRERTESLLRVISADMSGWARELGLYYSELGAQIDATDLTIVADTRDGPVSLSRMGSAANIIGYHVTAHLALHKWFIEQGQPMPAFLMLDQPSQAFYPDDVAGQDDEVISDEDRERVTALYALIQRVVSDLEGRLQVIVLDHANLNLSWFQEAVVANWRFGEALVPASWLEAADNS